ncbi:MAG TPA: type II toxin-antitoxin system prevent-host-death family antitoxin [Acetobacteraceae bacterium]|nr:type II toxin-antitoxin system prevent-host-death family antitoxin [Acetobacteraceae bacterium]
MEVPVSDAKAQLTELVRRAEAGEDIVLTRFGRHAVRLVPVVLKPTAAQRRALIQGVQAKAHARAIAGVSAARSQDFLYDQDGLPA